MGADDQRWKAMVQDFGFLAAGGFLAWWLLRSVLDRLDKYDPEAGSKAEAKQKEAAAHIESVRANPPSSYTLMFAVPGWSVSADSLKAEAATDSNNQPATLKAAKKRKILTYEGELLLQVLSHSFFAHISPATHTLFEESP